MNECMHLIAEMVFNRRNISAMYMYTVQWQSRLGIGKDDCRVKLFGAILSLTITLVFIAINFYCLKIVMQSQDIR